MLAAPGLAKTIQVRRLFGGWLARHIHQRAYFGWLYSKVTDPWACATSPYEQTKYERTLSAIPPSAPSPRVLEIGCGEGIFSERIAALGWSVVGLDVSEIALERARARCTRFPKVRFELGDAAKDRIDGEFDLVLAAEVLYYLGHGRRYLAACQRLVENIKSGGHLIAVNPFPRSQRLVRPFARDPALHMQNEEVCFEEGRPYAITVFGRV